MSALVTAEIGRRANGLNSIFDPQPSRSRMKDFLEYSRIGHDVEGTVFSGFETVTARLAMGGVTTDSIEKHIRIQGKC